MSSPSYSRKVLEEKIKSGKVDINYNALRDALYDFGWAEKDIKKCILRLRPIQCYKSKPHDSCPEAMFDFYRAKNIMEGNDVYTHFYVHPKTKRLVINSFKEL